MPQMAKKDPTKKDGGKGAPTGNNNSNMWLQLAVAFGIFVLLSFGYSLVHQYVTAQDETIPLSQVATDIEAGKITSVIVAGDTITAEYADKTEKTSRKQSD